MIVTRASSGCFFLFPENVGQFLINNSSVPRHTWREVRNGTTKNGAISTYVELITSWSSCCAMFVQVSEIIVAVRGLYGVNTRKEITRTLYVERAVLHACHKSVEKMGFIRACIPTESCQLMIEIVNQNEHQSFEPSNFVVLLFLVTASGYVTNISKNSTAREDCSNVFLKLSSRIYFLSPRLSFSVLSAPQVDQGIGIRACPLRARGRPFDLLTP